MKKNKKIKEASVVADIKGYLAGSKEKAIRRSKKVPWYLEKANKIKHSLDEAALLKVLKEESPEDGGRLSFSNKSKSKKDWKDRALQKYKDLKSQIKATQTKVEKGRSSGSLDLGPEKLLKSLNGQLKTLAKAVKKGGKDWERYMIDPDAAEKSFARQKEKETSKEKKETHVGSNEEVLRAVNNYLNLNTTASPAQDKKVKSGIDNILKVYAGKTKSSPEEFKRVSNWVEKKLYPASGFDIPTFIKNKSSNWRNLKLKDLPDDIKTQVVDALRDLGSKKDPSDSWRKWEQLPGDLQTKISNWYDTNAPSVKTSFAPQTSNVEKGKIAPKKRNVAGKIGIFAPKEIPGGTKHSKDLASKLNKSYPGDAPHTPPKFDGNGKKLYPGTAEAELANVYNKIGDEAIYGKDGMFDEIVDEIQKRNPDIKVHSVLNRYLEIEDQLGSDASDIEILKKKFTKQELKVLADIAEKTNPESFEKLPPAGYSEIEKALYPAVKKSFEKKGHLTKQEDDDSSYSSSGANTKELKLIWSNMLKSPIDDVDDKVSAMKKQNPEAFKSLEKQALDMLQKTFPKAYSEEQRFRSLKDAPITKKSGKRDLKAHGIDPKMKHHVDSEESQAANQAMNNVISAINNPQTSPKAFDKIVRDFKKATQDKDKLRRIVKNANDPSKVMQIISSEDTESDSAEQEYNDTMASLKRAEKRMTSQGSNEPRNLSPEELKKRKEMGAHAASIAALDKTKKKKIKPNTSKINAILRRRSEDTEGNKMASNESKKMKLKNVFEGFENSYDLKSEPDEESWESEAPVEKKDWMKDLSLSDLFTPKKKKKAKKDEKLSNSVVDLGELEKKKKDKK